VHFGVVESTLFFYGVLLKFIAVNLSNDYGVGILDKVLLANLFYSHRTHQEYEGTLFVVGDIFRKQNDSKVVDCSSICGAFLLEGVELVNKLELLEGLSGIPDKDEQMMMQGQHVFDFGNLL
jgi:hypothetical protein